MRVCTAFATAAALCCAAFSTEAVAARRIALLVGANVGWAQDQPLRHAHDDARRVASALLELGDFDRGDVRVLEEPTTDELRAAFDAVAKRGAAEETLFVFYYSGHADDQHLHLRGPPLKMEELHRRVRELPFQVKIGVLDACQSGSILAAKGGRPAPAFKVKLEDELDVRGTAFLTSSGADELSQEARALSGSVFTHHLISGLRGAADEDADARISLGELYRYASVRTTLDTAPTRAGAQRPAFSFDLKGRGDIFLTRLAGPSGVLRFPPQRRCFVTDLAERRLLAEVSPDQSQTAQLALPVGSYVLKCVADSHYDVAAVTTTRGGQVEVASLRFQTLPLSSGLLKGGFGTAAEDPNEGLKRRGFEALRQDDPDLALRTFDQVLRSDLRDGEAFRGKAQAYLALAERAKQGGKHAEHDRLRKAALKADPRLTEDPAFADALPPSPVANAVQIQQADEKRVEQNLRRAYPRSYQGLGLGLSFVDAHGLLPFSVDYLVNDWLQPSIKLTLLSPGIGLAARVVPKSGAWSPFVGVGTHWSLAGMGLYQRPAGGSGYMVNEYEWASVDQFDRVFYVDAGLQWAMPRWQVDGGVTLMHSRPRDNPAFFALLPVVSFKYFLDRPGAARFVR